MPRTDENEQPLSESDGGRIDRRAFFAGAGALGGATLAMLQGSSANAAEPAPGGDSFLQAGTGAVSRTVQSKLRDVVNAADFGLAATNTSAQNKTAMDSALAYGASSSKYRKVAMPPGTFNIDPFTMPAAYNISLVGHGSGYAYGYPEPTPATILRFTAKGGAAGITQNASVVNPGPYAVFEDFQIDGSNVLSYGLKVSGQMVVNRVYISRCNTAGFHLQDVNQSHLDQVCAAGNRGDGLLIEYSAIGSTPYSVTRSTFRQNNGNGITLKDGSHGLWTACVFESNTGFGSHFYLPDRGNPVLDHVTFVQCWWESNGTDVSRSYNAVFDAASKVAASSPAYFNFIDCRFNNAGSSRRHLNLINVQLSSFRNCDFLGGDEAHCIQIGDTNHVLQIAFWDRNGYGGDPFTQNSTCYDVKSKGVAGKGGLVTSGTYTERNRTQPMGWWDIPVFDARDYTTSGAGSWTVDSRNVTVMQYIQIGNTMTINFQLDNTSVATGAATRLEVKVPNGATVARNADNLIRINDNGGGWTTGLCRVLANEKVIRFYVNLTEATNWTASRNATSIHGQITFEVS